MIVVDTNVLSELMRAGPDPQVLAWFGKQHASELFVTSITQAEVLFGVMSLPHGKRRKALDTAATETFERDFANRVLAFDALAAVRYARLAAERERRGRPISHFDAQIAAIALSTGASLATRNTRDFEHCGVELINPWTGH